MKHYDDIQKLSEAIRNLSKSFKGEQIYKICEGAYLNLTPEQINLYANPEFDDLQMRLIGNGFLNGLSYEQVKLYADPKFDKKQMEQIMYGLLGKLYIDKVKLYADPKFDYLQMEKIRNFLYKCDLSYINYILDKFKDKDPKIIEEMCTIKEYDKWKDKNRKNAIKRYKNTNKSIGVGIRMEDILDSYNEYQSVKSYD